MVDRSDVDSGVKVTVGYLGDHLLRTPCFTECGIVFRGIVKLYKSLVNAIVAGQDN